MRFMLLITCQEQLLLHKTTAWWHSWADCFAKQKWISEEESRSVFDKQNTNTKIWQIQKYEQNLSICPCVHPCILPFKDPFIRLSTYPSVHLSIHKSIHSSICPSIHLSAILSFVYRPSINLSSIHLSIYCPSMHLSICTFCHPYILPSIHLHSLKTFKLQAF